MASSMDKLAKELKNQITASDERKPRPYDTQAEVLRVEDGVAWVHIPGGVDETPVRLTINAKKGDNVNLHVANGTAWITGNSTNPPTDDSTANYAVNISNEVKKDITVLNTVVTENIEATNARFINVEADTAKIHTLTAEKILATVGYIEDLTADSITVEDISAASGYIKDLEADNITVQDISASSGYIKDLTAGNVTAQNVITDHATVGSLDANYAQINMANVNNAWIENGAIKKAEVFDENVFDLSGNRATLSRIDASKINVANLRADNLVVRRINGQPVVGGYTLIDSNSPGYSSKNPQALGWYEFVNAQWVLSTDTTVDMTKAYYQEGNEVSLYDQAYIDALEDDLQQQIDGAVETYTGTVVPTLVNKPYTDWYDTSVTPIHDERAKHIGDIYYVVNSAASENGYCYRFAYDNTSHAYSWVLIKDSDVTKALSDISELKTFESNTTSWMDETDEGLETIRTNHTALSGVVDKTVKESVQLWFTKANTTAPAKPTAEVTSTSTAGNAWRKVVPAWNASYPNYYYCWQYKFVDGTFGWSAVVRDIAMGETQGTARDAKNTADAALPASTFTSFESTTFKNVKDTVNEQSTKFTNMTTRLGMNSDGTGANTDIVAKESALEQTVEGVSSRVSKTETKLAGMYATSSTAASTAAKVATIVPTLSGYELANGATVTVKFTKANTAASPTLNLNGTGAKAIKTYSGGNLTADEYEWKAGSTFTFTYNGTNWLMQDSTASVRMNSAETEISQNAEQIALRAKSSDVYTKDQVYTKTQTDTQVSAAKAEIKVTTDGISSEVSKVSSAKYVTSSNSGWTLANIKNYAVEGHIENWNVTSTENIRAGDVVYVYGKDTTRNCYVYIKTTVRSVESSTRFSGVSHGYEDILPVETIKSTINQSADSVKIQANHVEIDGTATFNAIKSSVESTVQTAVDGIEVGGRNLLRRSDYAVYNTSDYNSNGNGATFSEDRITVPFGKEVFQYPYTSQRISTVIPSGTKITCSAYVYKQTIADGNHRVYVSPLRSNNTVYWSNIHNIGVNSTGRHIWTFTTTEDVYGFVVDFDSRNSTSGEMILGRIKVEIGDKATDWTPAPEDARSEIDAKKSVHTLDTTYSYTYADILTYSAEGFGGTWISSGALANGVKIGDTVRLKVTVSDMSNAPVYIVGTVTDVKTDAVIITSHGLDTTIIDGGNILTNSITANQIAANAVKADELDTDSINNSGLLSTGALTVGAKSEVLNSNIQIGGANLIPLSRNLKSFTIENTSHSSVTFTNADCYLTITTSTSSRFGLYYDIAVSASTTYTISFKASSVTGTISLGVGNRTGSNAGWSDVVAYKQLVNGTNTATFTTSSAITKIRIYIGGMNGSHAYLSEMKLESGNKATDWSPALADMSGAKYLTSSYSQPYSKYVNWVNRTTPDTYIVTSSSGVNVGDVVYIECDCTTTGTKLYVQGEVTAIPRDTQVTIYPLGIVDRATYASKTATTYITHIDNDGIRIHPASTENNSVVINAKGMEVFKGGITDEYSVAKYGDTARIGKESGKHINLTSTGVEVCSGGTNWATFGATTRVGGVTIDQDYFQIERGNDTIVDIGLGSGSMIGGVTTGIYYILCHYQVGLIGALEPSSPYLQEGYGFCSLSEGGESYAIGDYSHASGYGIITRGAYQTAIGKFNDNSTSNAFEIGRGTDDDNRNNIFAVSTGGSVNIASSQSYKVNGTVVASARVKTTFTPTASGVSNYSSYGNSYYEKAGNVVHVHVGVKGVAANTVTAIYTLPSGYRPTSQLFGHGTGGASDNIGYMEISTAGVIQVRSSTGYIGADITYFV